jgi:hypothetical protein
MKLQFHDSLPAFVTESVLPQVQWLLSIPVVQGRPADAHAAVARLLAAPPALGESRPAVGALRFELTWEQGFRRDRVQPEAFTIGREEKDLGVVDILFESQNFGLYRLNIRPGGSIPLHVHRKMQEWELVLSKGILLQGKEVAVFHHEAWQHDFPHRYDNPTSQWTTVLCVDSPAFIPIDEIPVA